MDFLPHPIWRAGSANSSANLALLPRLGLLVKIRQRTVTLLDGDCLNLMKPPEGGEQERRSK